MLSPLKSAVLYFSKKLELGTSHCRHIATVRMSDATSTRSKQGNVCFDLPPKASRLSPAGASLSDDVKTSDPPVGYSCTSVLLVCLVLFCCSCVSILVPYALLCERSSSAGSSLSQGWSDQFCGVVRPWMQAGHSAITAVEARWNTFMLQVELDSADVTPIRRLGLLAPTLVQAPPSGAQVLLFSTASMTALQGKALHAPLQLLLSSAPSSPQALQQALAGARIQAARSGVFPYSSGNAAWCATGKAPNNVSTLCARNSAAAMPVTAEFFPWPAGLACAASLSASQFLGRSSYDEMCRQVHIPGANGIEMEISASGNPATTVEAGASAAPPAGGWGGLKCHARALRDTLLQPLLQAAATDLHQEAAWVAPGVQPLPSVAGSLDEAELRFLQESSSTRHHVWVSAGTALTPLHYDTEHNTYTQLTGSKLWLLMPPSAWRLLGGYPSGHHAWRQAAVHWAHNGTMLDQCNTKPSDGLAPVCLHADAVGGVTLACSACGADSAGGAWPAYLVSLEAGSTLAVPPMWFHAVLSHNAGSQAAIAVNSWAPDLPLQEAQDALAQRGPPLTRQPHTDVPGAATILRTYVWSTLQALLTPVQEAAKRYLQQRRKWAAHNLVVDATTLQQSASPHTAKQVWGDLQRLLHLTPQCLVGWLWISRWHVGRRGIWAPLEQCTRGACAQLHTMPLLESCDDVTAYLQQLSSQSMYMPVAGTPWRNVLGSIPAQATLEALKGGKQLASDFVRSVQDTGMTLFSVLPSDVRQRGGGPGERRSSFLSTGQALHLSANAAALARGWATVEMLLGDHVDELVAGVASMHLPLSPPGFSRGYPGSDGRGGADWLTPQQVKEVERTHGMPWYAVPQPTQQCGLGAAGSPRPAGAAQAAQLYWHVLVQPQL